MNEYCLPSDRARVEALAKTMNQAIPEGTPSGYVMSALCLMLQFGLHNAPPEIQDRIRATVQRAFAERVLH
jgi:hypothetical protein